MEDSKKFSPEVADEMTKEDEVLDILLEPIPQKPVKYYILDGIRSHSIFKDIKFWEACLLYQMSTNREDFDFHNERYSIDVNLVTENYVSKITKTFMGIALHMKDVSMSTKTVIEILTKYARKYRIPSESFEELQTFLDLTFAESDEKMMISGLSTASKPECSEGDSASVKQKESSSSFIGSKLKGVFGSLVQTKLKSEEDYFKKRVFSVQTASQFEGQEEHQTASNFSLSKSGLTSNKNSVTRKN